MVSKAILNSVNTKIPGKIKNNNKKKTPTFKYKQNDKH